MSISPAGWLLLGWLSSGFILLGLFVFAAWAWRQLVYVVSYARYRRSLKRLTGPTRVVRLRGRI